MISPNHRIRTSAIALTALCGALAVAPATASASVYTITAPIPGVIGEVVPAPKDSQTVRRYALVIGANDTRSRAQAPLRFADDDAARIAELLAELGVEAALLTTFDKDSQAVFGELVAEARSPSRTQVLATHRELKRRMEQAKAAGARVEYLIYYSGHGDVGPDGQGYLTLAGGQQLTRHDLFVELLGTSPADHNHIIVDACRSEEFVLSRGDGWRPDRTETDYSRDVQAYLDRRHLGHFPNTGVVLASSVDQQTHEWERYRGGVFTHELLSGLRGGADINGDGEIEYSELGAFVAAANSGVDDPRARLRVVVRPPRGDERLPLLVHDAVAARRVLFFERGDARRYTVEDHRGVRLADLRRSGEQPGYLRLPPGEVFVYREESAVAAEGERPRLEAKITGSQARMIRANELRYEPTRKATRGALDVAFRDGLFVVPYGVGYYKGYTDREGMLGVKDPDWEVRVWREENGELVQVAEVKQDGATTTPPPAAEGPTQAQCYGDGCDEDWSDDDDDDDGDDDWRSYWTRSRFWGALGVGIIFAPTGAESQIRLTDDEQRIDSSDTQPWGGPVRGFDLSWQTFSIHKRKYPTWVVYFRSGYTRGHADFAPRSVGGSFSQGDAQSMTYSAVPLYFGCNLYVFN
ncbi:MAG: caspase family protein, partial [Myxococcales bacterium]|nr:caspase family protein [Myxococcales bacterium]